MTALICRRCTQLNPKHFSWLVEFPASASNTMWWYKSNTSLKILQEKATEIQALKMREVQCESSTNSSNQTSRSLYHFKEKCILTKGIKDANYLIFMASNISCWLTSIFWGDIIPSERQDTLLQIVSRHSVECGP